MRTNNIHQTILYRSTRDYHSDTYKHAYMCEIVWDKVLYKNTTTSSVSSAERRSILKYMFVLNRSHQNFKATIMIKVSKGYDVLNFKESTMKVCLSEDVSYYISKFNSDGRKNKCKISWYFMMYLTPLYFSQL